MVHGRYTVSFKAGNQMVLPYYHNKAGICMLNLHLQLHKEQRHDVTRMGTAMLHGQRPTIRAPLVL